MTEAGYYIISKTHDLFIMKFSGSVSPRAIVVFGKSHAEIKSYQRKNPVVNFFFIIIKFLVGKSVKESLRKVQRSFILFFSFLTF